MLVRLMYASRSSSPQVGQGDLAAILKKSNRNNADLGVTGVLCFSSGTFLQVLEGGRMAISRLYNRIAGDSRHRDVTLLLFEEIGERRFAHWAMGQVSHDCLNPTLLMKYSDKAVLDPHSVSGAMSMALFNELVATASVVCPSSAQA